MLHDIKGCTGEERSAILTNYPRAVKCHKLTYLRVDWASLDVYTMFDGNYTYWLPTLIMGCYRRLAIFSQVCIPLGMLSSI